MRLYTPFRVEFTIGNLYFSQDDDPFANLAIPQDVALDLASRLNEDIMGGDPQDAEVISAEPVTVHHPPTTTGSSQGGANRDEVLAASQKCVEPRDVPFSTMTCNRRPLFRRVLVKKRPKFEILDLTKDFPASSHQEVELRRDDSDLYPSTLEPLTEEHVYLAPEVTTGYSMNFLELPYTIPGGFQINEESMLWKKQDAFCASRPLLLERIRRDYDAICDPLEIHKAMTCHLIKALNASHGLACRADQLNDPHAEACQKERALQFQVKELQEENKRLKTDVALATSEKRKTQDQSLAEIEKHDLLHTRFTILEGENFDLHNKLKRVQLLQDQANKRASEAEQSSKAAEEALLGRIERAIDEYQRFEDFQMEADEEEETGLLESVDNDAPSPW
ncbi:hypothetical protein LIER_21568 [Lithospermum erythrorhizon]|uniref:Uncharacterized protein n=1 Tax=Lithospermum erythrorhizon TaxID=34254 RepID=A0AAV3QTV8_LITER